jgi:glutathione synthase/RimK-type ligase-like ATP-grasp enzyme
MPRPIALVSCAEARHLDTDLPLIIRALGDRGIIAEIVDWDNAAADWKQYEAAIVRSPWDYHRRYEEFLAWLTVVSSATTLHNSADIIRWNTNKEYLSELVEANIDVVPTTFVRGAEDLVLITNEGMLDRDIVVKPTISAGSNNTERHEESPVKAAAHLGSLIDAGMVAMVQPYQRFIDERGETGMLYFNGKYSHSFRKGAILATGENIKNGLFVEEDISPRDASSQERALGASVMSFVKNKFGEYPLYARVDVVRGSAGVPVLMELELAEPSLFLHVAHESPSRFASAVVARR